MNSSRLGSNGERVVDGRVCQALAEGSPLGDVLDLPDQVKRSFLCVAHARHAHRDPDLVSVVVYVALLDLVPGRARRDETSHLVRTRLTVVGVGEVGNKRAGQVGSDPFPRCRRGPDWPG